MMQNNNKDTEPKVVYKQEGKIDGVVPSKTFSYKRDSSTGEVIIVLPKTHQFEKKLKEEIGDDLKQDRRFPTKKPVFVSIVHGLHSERGFQECDIDNRAKTVLDALKGVVYDDDTQVHMLWTQKMFLKWEEESYYRIAIKMLVGTISTKAILSSIGSGA